MALRDPGNVPGYQSGAISTWVVTVVVIVVGAVAHVSLTTVGHYSAAQETHEYWWST